MNTQKRYHLHNMRSAYFISMAHYIERERERDRERERNTRKERDRHEMVKTQKQ